MCCRRAAHRLRRRHRRGWGGSAATAGDLAAPGIGARQAIRAVASPAAADRACGCAGAVGAEQRRRRRTVGAAGGVRGAPAPVATDRVGRAAALDRGAAVGALADSAGVVGIGLPAAVAVCAVVDWEIVGAAHAVRGAGPSAGTAIAATGGPRRDALAVATDLSSGARSAVAIDSLIAEDVELLVDGGGGFRIARAVGAGVVLATDGLVRRHAVIILVVALGLVGGHSATLGAVPVGLFSSLGSGARRTGCLGVRADQGSQEEEH